jgi:hypothetical protein
MANLGTEAEWPQSFGNNRTDGSGSFQSTPDNEPG